MTKSELIEIFLQGHALKFAASDSMAPLSPGPSERQALAESLEVVVSSDEEVSDGIECNPKTWFLVLSRQILEVRLDVERPSENVKVTVRLHPAQALDMGIELRFRPGPDGRQMYRAGVAVSGLSVPVSSSAELSVERVTRFFHSALAAKKRAA
jgi:hypothetical protein